MPYVKLDCGMIDSTIWIEREARELFITALLMAEPREFAEPQKQIAVGSLEYTGFEVPAGWYGFVDASGPGIIRRAIMGDADGRKALTVLGSPDDGSRSSDFEGRRMIRIDGGYLILNYMKYREKDHTAAERARRYRQRRANIVTRDAVTVTRNVTQAEAEAEADKSKRKSESRARGSRLPEGWRPSEEQKRWAEARRPDVDVTLEAETFANFWSAAAGRGAVKMNWGAAWRNWIVKSKPTSAVNGHSKTFTKLSRLQRLKDEYGSADCDALPATGVPRLGGDSCG